MKNKIIRIYDGANFCPECDKCPVIDLLPEKKLVKISDPSKPENGVFTMTLDEYNVLIKNAKTISL